MTNRSLSNNESFSNKFLHLVRKFAEDNISPEKDTHELALILWQSANKSQKILLDTFFQKLLGHSFSQLINHVPASTHSYCILNAGQ
jgi:hypothetical protein